MISYDKINASFELLAGIFLLLNIKEVYKKKTVIGVSLLPTVFFTLWSIWNIFYYPAIGQKVSYYAGIFVGVVNGTWVLMALYYKYRNKGMFLKHIK